MTYFNWVQRIRPTRGVHSLLRVRGVSNRGTIVHPFLLISSLLGLFVESRGRSVQCKSLGWGSTAVSQSIPECMVTWLAAGSVQSAEGRQDFPWELRARKAYFLVFWYFTCLAHSIKRCDIIPILGSRLSDLNSVASQNILGCQALPCLQSNERLCSLPINLIQLQCSTSDFSASSLAASYF